MDDSDLAALYAGASLVVMPSRAEGFGLPALEAITLVVPVVTSDDPAMREVGAGDSCPGLQLAGLRGDIVGFVAQLAR